MHVLARGDLLQRLRLGSGLILLAFAATHFLNHALGLVSVEAERGGNGAWVVRVGGTAVTVLEGELRL